MPRERVAPPSDTEIDRAVEGFERFSASLVRLEPYPLEQVRREVEAFTREVERHLTESTAAPGGRGETDRARLAREHERFRTSVDQLVAILAVVEQDDHGGHRQALGQYGRIFTEALRLHRTDERPRRRRRGTPHRPGNP